MDPGKSTRTNYSVVCFIDEDNSVYSVPNIWIRDPSSTFTTCFWPEGGETKINKAVEDMVPPNKNWMEVKIKIVAQSRTLKGAKEKEKYYENASDVERFSTGLDTMDEEPSVKESLPSCSYNFIPMVPKFPHKRKLIGKSLIDRDVPISSKRYKETPRCYNLNDEVDGSVSQSIKKLEDSVLEIKSTLSVMLNMMSEIKAQCQSNAQILQQNETVVEMPNIKCIPVNSVQEIKYLEETIEDMEEFNQLVKYLGSFGGRDGKDITRRILSKLITNNFAKCINWVGGKEKTAFKDFSRILQLITASVHRLPQYKNFPQADVEDTIKRWLRSAADRDGGRSSRRHVDDEL